jgi:leader peptidase (prepilin peptidase)/N-methyltransferase
LDILLEFALFVVGLAFGSFLNVCISRIPRDLSVVAPSSHCPHCRSAIRWRDNIPLLSWALLRGRCRQCGLPISRRYPAVELLTAVMFVACFVWFGYTWLTTKSCVFCFLILGLIFMDAETGLLPHEFTYSGIGLGLAFAGIAPVDPAATAFLLNLFGLRDIPQGPPLFFLDVVIAAVFGAALFYLTWALYYLVRRRHGMGFGDIALMAMVGAFLGLKLTLLVVFLAPITATLFAAATFGISRMAGAGLRPAHEEVDATASKSFLLHELPFGVFLGATSFIALFFGKQIWQWYFGLL